MPNIDPELQKELVKSAPPVAVTAWHYLLDLPVEKWVSVVTLIYVGLQAFFLVRDRMKKGRTK